MIVDILKTYSSEIVAAVIPSLVAAFFASKWWQNRGIWLKRLISVLAKSAVAHVETSYVKPAKSALQVEKLPVTQQEIAKDMAQLDISNALGDLGVTLFSAAAPMIGASIEKAVENMKKTIPTGTQRLFPD